MTHWHDTMVDHPEPDGAVYATGWTISGLAVPGPSSRSGFWESDPQRQGKIIALRPA